MALKKIRVLETISGYTKKEINNGMNEKRKTLDEEKIFVGYRR